MEKVVIKNIEFTACSAIALEAGDTERQPAIFVHDISDKYKNGDSVLFGYDLPEDERDVKNILADPYAFTTDYETLLTVVI